MYLSPDDAKTDVILAAAVAVVGVSLRSFALSTPFYPRPGALSTILDLVWVVALTALVPILLARYREDGVAAFGLTGADGALVGGLPLAVPAVAAGALVQLLVLPDGGAGPWLGRLAGPVFTGSAVSIALVALRLSLLSVGTLLLIGFLAVRARDGFPRSPDMPLSQLVRTIGLVAVGVAAVGGLLRALPGGTTGLAIAAVNAIGLAAVLLLVDRRIPAGVTVPRAAVIAPVVVVVVGNVFATGGLFRGDLLAGLTTSALALGVTVAVAGLAQTRDGAAAAVALVLAAHAWPTCYSPLVLVRAVEPLGGLC